MSSNPEHPAQQPTTAEGSPIAPVWNLPNVLTMLRIAMVPVFVVLLWQDTTVTDLIALAVFLLAAATDKLDGTIARKRGIVTNFGKIADPFADKLLTGAAMVVLAVLGVMPWWAVIVIQVREIGITVLRFVMARRSVIAASNGGKLKTVLQVVFLAMMMLPAVALLGSPIGAWWETAAQVIMVLATAVTVVTGLDYCWRAWRITRDQKQ